MLKPLSDAFSPEVMAEMAKPVQTFDPRCAQMVEGVEPKWYVVEIYSRHAEKELARRRFGLYRTPIMPGYVFVFLWDTDANWSRLEATPAVSTILGWIDDSEIDRVRFLDNCEYVSEDAASRAKARVLRKVHRKRMGSSRRKKRGNRKLNGKAKHAA
jgi:hypothetical protein